jgi:tetratricopeptide (TPR) repeat protein
VLLVPVRLAAGTFRAELERVHELIASKRYAEAQTALEHELAPLARQPGQQALLLEAQGTIEAARERFPEAVAALHRCLEYEAHLSAGSHRRILFLLGQLQLRTGEYAAAASALEAWFQLEKRPAPKGHLLLGSAYLGSGRLEAGIAQLERAKRAGQPMSEAWARQLLAAYEQAGRASDAATLLRQLLKDGPDERADWLRLAALQLKLQAPAEALGILEAAEHRGWLTEPSELLELVRLQLALGAPYRAAQLLEKALAEQRLTAGRDTSLLLIDAWRQAGETGRALATCRDANRKLRDPLLYRLEAELAFDLGQWEAVVAAAERAIGTIDGQSEAEASLLQGIALASLQRWEAARTALRRASRVVAIEPRVAPWLRYVEQVLEQSPSAGG